MTWLLLAKFLNEFYIEEGLCLVILTLTFEKLKANELVTDEYPILGSTFVMYVEDYQDKFSELKTYHKIERFVNRIYNTSNELRQSMWYVWRDNRISGYFKRAGCDLDEGRTKTN